MRRPRISKRPETAPLTEVVHRNIATLLDFRKRNDRDQTVGDKIAERLTRALGSVYSIAFHLIFIASWVAVNFGAVASIQPFDPPPFTRLALVGTLEAIFLTLLILLTQNRLAWVERRQNELDLQINLLAEHEITQMLQLVEAIATKLGIPKPELFEELKRDVHPQTVLDEIDKADRDGAP